MMFEDFARMIAGASWKVSFAYGVEFEECEAEANLIFCECRANFNPDCGVPFSSYLWSRLQGLGNSIYKCMRSKQQCADSELDSICPDSSESVLYEISKEELSKKSKEVLDYITSFSWDQPGEGGWHRPTKTNIKQLFKITDSEWKELAEWWKAQCEI